MLLITTVSAMQARSRALRAAGKTLGLVPTMGALHAGHLSLVRAAQETCAAAVASIFVNPLQFGPHEDFSRYPRSFDHDCQQLEAAGVDAVFAPDVSEMYPAGAATYVDVGPLGDRLDGASRPGHFRGVATVVAKLFNIVGPTHAFFGQKDAAQIAVLRAMVRDLNFPLELIACPIVREPDGLAMSSRNTYLSAEERGRALVLSRALLAAERAANHGELAADALRAAMLDVLESEPAVRLDYAAVVDPTTLLSVQDTRGGALVAVAAYLGSTRLIDNFLIGPLERC